LSPDAPETGAAEERVGDGLARAQHGAGDEAVDAALAVGDLALQAHHRCDDIGGQW
jgi:hypothetical protein